MRTTVLLITIILFLSSFTVLGDNVSDNTNGYDDPIGIEEIVVKGRKLEDIGVTKTVLDSVVLRDNVTNSLAEVLSQNTSIYIKSYGRGTLASASFRGTAPSHTQVTWNDMKLNSPMLGMVDFSLIPSYFIDDASLYHGAGSVGVAGGGLGGAITLSTKPTHQQGPGLNFIQGISSFHTYDDFLKFTYGTKKLQSSTRVYYVNSENKFEYTNYNKKNDDGSYPVEKNKNGQFRDFHILQELYYSPDDKNRFSLAAWFLDSDRGIPMLNVNYREEDKSENKQNESTLRLVGSWDRYGTTMKIGAKAGYTYSNMVYRYLGDRGTDELVEMIHSQSIINTAYGKVAWEFYPSKKWLFTADVSAHINSVSSREKYVQNGYEKTRAEVSMFASAKYHPAERLGLGVDMRAESYGRNMTPLIPAAFVDYILWPKFNVVVKASIAKNYRYPTLNDLYFLPGGNDSLQTEKGYTYDGGIEFGINKKNFILTADVTAYNSQIKDWILWLPTFKGFWSPINVKRVHSYGLELKGKLFVRFNPNWTLQLDANWAKTRSINHGDPMSWTDESIGKQLVYVPEYSSSVTGRLSWKGYTFTYKYNYYSERFTTTSNETASKVSKLGEYYMNDISLEKILSFGFGDISLKFNIYNLFDEEYVSVLSRPMPGRNYGFFIGITPKWKQPGQKKPKVL